jgi:hypothetical protein
VDSAASSCTSVQCLRRSNQPEDCSLSADRLLLRFSRAIMDRTRAGRLCALAAEAISHVPIGDRRRSIRIPSGVALEAVVLGSVSADATCLASARRWRKSCRPERSRPDLTAVALHIGETDCVAEDAVLIGPVSAPRFPANREINREFCRFHPSGVIFASIRLINSMACSEIPYATEQGILAR